MLLRRVVIALDWMLDTALLVLFILLFLIGGYTMYDTWLICSEVTFRKSSAMMSPSLLLMTLPSIRAAPSRVITRRSRAMTVSSPLR